MLLYLGLILLVELILIFCPLLVFVNIINNITVIIIVFDIINLDS